jgi:hypothetical protein
MMTDSPQDGSSALDKPESCWFIDTQLCGGKGVHDKVAHHEGLSFA